MTASDYYNNLNTALDSVNEAIAMAQGQMTDEYDPYTDYSDILMRLTSFKRTIIRMLNANKFLRLSLDGFAQQAQAQTGRRVEVIHTIKDYETPFSIANLYGVALDDILNKNNITTADMVAGYQLLVEIAPSEGLNQIYNNIPTYGDQSGNLVFGADLSDTLSVDTNGDLAVLSPEDTLQQGILNRTQTKQGDYPLMPDFGVPELLGSEIPDDLISSFYMKDLENILAQDNRIASVNALSLVRTGNGVDIIGQITAINNKNLNINS